MLNQKTGIFSRRSRVIGLGLFILALAGPVLAQESRAPIDNPQTPAPSAPLVTAAATGKRVRFVSPGTVVQLRLEVYNEAGQKVFDTELRGGNVLDWDLQDGAGERVLSGSYACLLTIKSLSGRLSQRAGMVTVREKNTEMHTGALPLSSAQQQAIGPVEDDNGLTVLQENEEAITAVTHDGTEGQVSRTRGALSFRLGDFFRGKDKEQMRLTEEGNLGIGTSEPRFKLDVTGSIRAREGFVFSNGSTLNVNDKGALTLTDASGNITPKVAGTGTPNTVVKWADGSGNLTDSSIFDNGNVGIGTNSPANKLDVVRGTAGLMGKSTYEMASFEFNGDAKFGVYSSVAGPSVPSAALTFGSTNQQVSGRFPGFELQYVYGATNAANQARFNYVERNGAGAVTNYAANLLTINGNGDVTLNPVTSGVAATAKLDVAGLINTSTQYNIGGNRVLSVSGNPSNSLLNNTNLFVGVRAGQSNTPGGSPTDGSGTRNTFVGSKAGQDNTSGFNNSFFGLSAGEINTIGVRNSFFGSSAGTTNTEGDDNSFFGFGAGLHNTTGSNNTYLGSTSDGNAGLTNATAVGYRAFVTQNNSLVLGSINLVNSANADTNVCIGTTAPARRLHIKGACSDGVGQTDLRVEGTGTVGAGMTLMATGTGGRTYSWISTANTAGAGAGKLAAYDVTASAYRMVIDDAGNVGIGQNTPAAKLDVNGTLRVGTLAAATATHLCVSASNELASCSSSLRYKQRVASFGAGLDIVNRLRPVTFNWKGNDQPDVGLIAEEVNRVAPLFVTHNAHGQIEGVKYDQLTVVLVNAVQEQQRQLEAKDGRIASLEARLASLERMTTRHKKQTYSRRSRWGH